jgi:hypothetical protein
MQAYGSYVPAAYVTKTQTTRVNACRPPRASKPFLTCVRTYSSSCQNQIAFATIAVLELEILDVCLIFVVANPRPNRSDKGLRCLAATPRVLLSAQE